MAELGGFHLLVIAIAVGLGALMAGLGATYAHGRGRLRWVVVTVVVAMLAAWFWAAYQTEINKECSTAGGSIEVIGQRYACLSSDGRILLR